MPKTYDIAVLGASAAGYAAAWSLADRGRSVIVVDTEARTTESPLSDWAPRDLFRMKGLGTSLAKASGAVPFDRVRYHNAPLQRSAEHKSRATAGYFFRTEELVKALRSRAETAGAENYNPQNTPEMHLEENGVRLVGGRTVHAELLLIAHSRPNEIVRDLGLAVRSLPHSSLTAAGIDVAIPGRRDAEELSGVLNVVELPEHSDLGMFFVTDRTLHVRVVSSSVASGTRSAELSTLVAQLKQAELLPDNLPLGKATGAVWRPPAGVALDLETHVAKRCLLIGTAGGFVETIAGQTVMPTVRSALVGADVANDALDADNPQEALMQFKTAWRTALAEYLRPPTTSLRMLMPLLFVNDRILARFTRAMLYGENI